MVIVMLLATIGVFAVLGYGPTVWLGETGISPIVPLVPPMMIQPLLENTLHYGSKTSDMPLRPAALRLQDLLAGDDPGPTEAS